MSLFNVRSPVMRPLWRRVAVVAATLGWAAVELVSGAVVWAMLFGAAGLWCLWEFFVVFCPENYGDKPEDKP